MRTIFMVFYLDGECWTRCPAGAYESRNSANYHIAEAQDSEFPDCVCSGTSCRVEEIGVQI